MTTVALAGLVVLDCVFDVTTLPSHAGKHFARGYREIIGGIATNAALAVVRLGGTARLVSRLGDDAAGRTLRSCLVDAGVDVRHLETRPTGATPVSAVLVDATGERLIVNYKDSALLDDTPDIDLAGVDAALADLRWPQATRALAGAARSRGVPMVLDVDQAPEADSAILPLASHLVFGEQALAALVGSEEPVVSLYRAAAFAPDAALAVTTGGGGVHWRLADGRSGHVVAHDVRVVDTLGAGDVFHGAVALALAEGQGFAQALTFANAVAALKVTRPSGPEHLPTRDETEALLRSVA